MDYYPQEFSAQARARVEAERLKAATDLENIHKQPQAELIRRRSCGPYGLLWTNAEEDFHNYILRVFLAFAREACALGKQGTWTVDRIRSETDEFLRRFTIEAYYDKGHDRSGRRFRDMISHWNGSLLPEVTQEFQKSGEWRQFEEELLGVAESQAASYPRAPNGGQDENTGASSWEAIEISFLSDERVQIRNGTSIETRNYGEFGFADRRVGRGKPKPNRAWHVLREMAQQNGIIPDGAKIGDWRKVERRMQEIRKVLRKHFRNSGDPVPFVKNTGYRACFKIGCSSSFNT
jgi:hypothetical protein